MALSTYNITAEQGSDYVASIAYTDDEGDIVNMSGYTSRMQVRRFAGSIESVLSLTNTSGMTISATAGTVALSISSSALTAVPAGKYAYDLEVIDNGGKVTKLLQGTFTVEAEVTR